MALTVDFYYWVMSDWAYFGNPRLARMKERYGLQVNYFPVDLATVYARTGGLKLAIRSRERQEYRMHELRRFRAALDMPLNLVPRYDPITGLLPSLFVVAAIEEGHDVHALTQAIMTAMWVEERDIEDASTLVAIAGGLGLDGQALLARARKEETRQKFFEFTDTAISRGVFGAPFYFFRDEPFWGQDRLEMLEARIAQAHQGGATAV